MATEVIHEHTGGGDNGSTGIIVGVLLVILFAFLVFYFLGNGFLRGMGGGTNVQIPDKVNVNVQGGGQGGAK